MSSSYSCHCAASAAVSAAAELYSLVYIFDLVDDEDDPGPSESMIDKKLNLPSADAGFALL